MKYQGLELLKLMRQGKSVADASYQLDIASNTAYVHLARVLKKCRAGSIKELLAMTQEEVEMQVYADAIRLRLMPWRDHPKLDQIIAMARRR